MSNSPTVRPATLLLTFGADRDDQIRSRDGHVKVAGSSDLFGLLDADHPHHRLRITRQLLRQKRRPNLVPYHCILNLITEPENNDRVLDNLKRLLRTFPGRVINRPEAVLRTTRDQVARRLADVPGLVVPKAIRLRKADAVKFQDKLDRLGMEFPLILREPGTHLGTSQVRVDDLDELMASMRPGTEYIATQFVDYRSDDGLFRKYRIFFIGSHLIFRHQLFSDFWNVHGKDRDRFMVGRPDLMGEEKALFATPEGAFPPAVGRILAAVRQAIDLDYFGLDFGIMPDGRVILFEANATMNFFSILPNDEFAYVRACVPPARAAFRELLGLPPSS